MNIRQTYIALFLLVLFCRVLVPEVAILALHEHEHTEDVISADVTVEKAHLHCDVDELYNGSFLSSRFTLDLAFTMPIGGYTSPYSFVWKFTFPNNTFLRGPPVA